MVNLNNLLVHINSILLDFEKKYKTSLSLENVVIKEITNENVKFVILMPWNWAIEASLSLINHFPLKKEKNLLKLKNWRIKTVKELLNN